MDDDKKKRVIKIVLTWYNDKIVKMASTEPAAPSKCPVAPLVEETLILSQCPSKTVLIARFSAASPIYLYETVKLIVVLLLV